MYKTIKNKALFNWIKFILVISLAVVCYFQWTKIPWNDATGIQLKHPIYLLFSLLLIPANIWLEQMKWKKTLMQSELSVEKEVLTSSFYAGWISGILTPNMLGNFIGRMFYFQKRDRLKIILNTLISNFAQFLVSIVFGVLGVLILNTFPENIALNLFWIIILSILIIGLITFYFAWHLFPFPTKFKKRFFERLKAILKNSLRFRVDLLYLSALRHLVFSFQFFFMFNAFQEAWDLNVLFWIWQLYLWTTLTPSIFIGKLMVRETIAVWIFTQIGFLGFPTLLSSLFIWVGNVLLPALIGLLIIKNRKS